MAKRKKSKEDEEENSNEMSKEEKSILKLRWEEIQAMPEGEERDRAIADLSQDYEGMTDILGENLSFANDLFNTKMPEGRQVGQVYVAANPMEHLSSALRQGLGAYQRYKTLGGLNELSEAKSRANAGTMTAQGAQGSQPQLAPGQGSGVLAGSEMPDLSTALGMQIPQQMQSSQPLQQSVETAQALRTGQGQVNPPRRAARGLPVPENAPRMGRETMEARMGINIPDQMQSQNDPGLRPQLEEMKSHEQQPLFGQSREKELARALSYLQEPDAEGAVFPTEEELWRRGSRNRVLGGW